MREPKVRKPSVILSGISFDVANVLRPIKETLEILTGSTRGSSELKGLKPTATDKEVVDKLNEIIRRLNASGDDHV